MTEPRSMDPFESRFAGRVRAYTDAAAARRIDALEVSRMAMVSSSVSGPLARRRWLARFLPESSAGWAAVVVVVTLTGVVGISVFGRTFDSIIGPQPTPVTASTPSLETPLGGPVPEFLRHTWQRPFAVTPGQDQWGTGFLSLLGGRLEFGREPGAAASRSAIEAAGPDALTVTATAETLGCSIGDVGAYRWALEGKGTILTLTAASADSCAAREKALAGDWVRSDLAPRNDLGALLAPGTHLTSAFNPFDAPGASRQLSYTAPEGWTIIEDQPASLVLHRLPDAAPRHLATDLLVVLFAQPRLSANFESGEPCGPFREAPNVGHGIDDITAAIQARAGVIATAPSAVTIGGYDGQMLDLHLAPSWTGGCQAPEGAVVGIPILNVAGPDTGPSVGIGPDHPMRLILLDLSNERTMAIAIVCVEPSQPSAFEAQMAEAMPIIDSFEFHPPAP